MTCTGWGGKNNSLLFATSGNHSDEDKNGPGGHVFSFDAGIKGVKLHEFKATAVPEFGGELEDEIAS